MSLQTVFILAVLSFEIFPCSSQGEVIERVEAIINKKAIYKSDVSQFRKQVNLRAKIDPIFNNEPIAKNANPSDLEIVNFLVDEAIITDKFPINDSEVEQEINGIQTNLKIDREQLKSAISHEGYKFEDYYKLMRASLAKRQLIDRDIRSKAVVSDDDIRSEYNRAHAGSKSFHGQFHLYLSKFVKSDFKSSILAKKEAQKSLEESKKTGAFSGEDLGYLSYSDMSPSLQKVVQKLGPDKTSEVVEDGGSYIIVKVGEIKDDEETAPDPDKDALRGHLMESEFEHQIHLWLEHERSNNFVKINTKST